jgi:ATP-dependent DNA helicase RecQ
MRVRDTDRQLETTLSDTFGFSAFREHQQEIIQAILEGRDVFAVMPTGGGKSLCYQLPSLLLDGVCIVISPLISLMKDQVDNGNALGIRAAFINSTLTPEGQRNVIRSFRDNTLDLLYLAPERFTLGTFAEELSRGPVSLVAVDEAHCISEWGHDFRPDYLQLAELRNLLPSVPIAAFTATATEQVSRDIIQRLHLDNPFTVRASFNRPNLVYCVRMRDNVQRQILEAVCDMPGQPGIVYRLSRNDVEKTANMLQENGITALPYHAGLNSQERARNQEAFNRDKVQVIVATVAFGMGIDKSNVRFVIHGDLPKNMEGYYQETGRAGRDGEPARCLLFYQRGDMMRLGYFLDRIVNESERAIGWKKLKQMADYAENPVCRRRQLLNYFEEKFEQDNCGGCDICLQGVEELDATTEARMVMSAVFRTGQRFGAAHIIDIVVGAKTKKLLLQGHDKLPTHGVGKNRKKIFWRRLVDAMLSDGLLASEGDKFPLLRLTARGEKVLYGKKTYTLRMVKEIAQKTASRPTDAIEQPELFEKLREIRSRLAGEQDVPPYVIFSDKSLRDMCCLLPDTEERMLAVHGVGRTKLKSYAEPFMQAVADWLADNPEIRQPDLPRPAATRPATGAISATVQSSVKLARQGLSLTEIADARKLKPSTIATHLVLWLEQGNKLDIDLLIGSETRDLVEDQFKKIGSSYLKPVVEALGGCAGYDEARIVRAALQFDL